MRIRHRSLVIVAAALVAVGCSSDAEPAAEPAVEAPASEPSEATSSDTDEPADAAEPTDAPAPATDGPTITIEGFAFSTLEPVGPGTEIAVANLDGTLHTLTADDGSFNTGGLDGGASITITAPDAPGAYTFLCNIHPTMTGTLTVEA